MIRMLGVLAAGLVGGYAIAAFTSTPAAPPAAVPDASSPAVYFDASAPVEERLASLEQTVAAERDARLVLEEQITLLLEEIDRIDSAGPAVLAGEISGLIDAREAAAVRRAARRDARPGRDAGDVRQAQIDRLTEAGFGVDRAAQILERTSELQWETMQAQYEARAAGTSFNRFDLQSNPNWLLREELGDADYERYLEAMGQPTSVTIQTVFESSPAARLGLQPGDRIVAYNGTRIFSTGELRALSSGQASGGDAVIEVIRDGNRMQLSIPAGPMGVQVYGSRGTISSWRGN